MASQVELEIVASTRKATRELESFASKGATAMNALGAAVAVALAGFAGKQLVSGFKAVTGAAAKQEDAVNSLNSALKLSGSFSEAASKDMQEFASGLQKVTKIGDETTLEMLALAKSFGISNKDAQKLVATAADLSEATGISLEGAVRNLGKTYGGLTGELGEVVPALKNLTVQQLKAGDAVDYISKRFGGAAAAATNTYTGATAQLSNAYGDLLEELGSLVTKNPQVVSAIKLVTAEVQNFITYLSNNSGEIKRFFSSLAIGFNETLIAAKRLILESEFSDTTEDVRKLNLQLFQLQRSYEKGRITQQQFDDGARSLRDKLIEVQAPAAQLRKEIAELEKQKDININVNSSAAANIKDGIRQATADGITAGIDDWRRTIPNYGNTDGPRVSGPGGDFDILSNNLAAGVSQDVPAARSAFDQFIEDLNSVGESLADIGKTLLRSIASNITKGRQGANAVLGAGAGAVATYFGADPESAAAIGGIVTDLAGANKEQTKEMINAFTKGLLEATDALIDNIPVFLEALAENSGEIITALVVAAPKITIALAKSMPLVAKALIDELVGGIGYQIDTLGPKFDELSVGIARETNNFINGVAEFPATFKQGVNDGLTDFYNGLTQGIKDLFGDAPDSFSSLFVESLGDAANKFVDTLKERAQEVIDRLTGQGDGSISGTATTAVTNPFAGAFGLTGETGGGGAGNIQVISTEVKFREKVLADIILQLARSNARLA